MARAKKKVACQDCGRTFGRKGELQQHRREEHSRRNMCPICKRAFESEKRLKMHSQFHNVDGEYKCFYCPKRFNKAWKMKIHLVNHSGRPSYVCEYCGDDFLYPGKIVAHLKHVHDVLYACKDCGFAVPLEYGQRPHRCRIYGCKDCLACFAGDAELAVHVRQEHGDKGSPAPCSPLTETASAPSSPPREAEARVSGSGGERGLPEPDVVVTEGTFGPETLEGPGRVRAGQRECVAPLGASRASSPGRASSGRSSPSPGPRDAWLQGLDGEERLCRDVLVSPSPPGTPGRAEHGARWRQDASDAVLAQRHRTPASASVIRSEEEEEEEEDEEEEGEEESPSHSYVSVLLRSPSSAPSGRFKVPGASTGPRRKAETAAAKSLRRKQDELDRAVKKKDLLNTLQLYMDVDARLTQCSQTSFESWLSSDSFSSPEHDYVFGFEASVSVGSHREEAHCHHSKKVLPMKEKVDMTFEDLCLF